TDAQCAGAGAAARARDFWAVKDLAPNAIDTLIADGTDAALAADSFAGRSTIAMTKTFKYRAFISYSHADRTWGDWLHRALESYRIPKRLHGTTGRDGAIPTKLFPIFRDRDELSSAAELSEQIRSALRQSAYLIIICSPRSANSRWVNEE